MTHRTDVKMIDASLSSGEIVSTVLESSHTRLPLYRDDPDNIIGVLHAKALLREVQRHDGHIDEMDVTTVARPPWFVPESTDCMRPPKELRRRRAHSAPVSHEYGSHPEG